VLRWDGVALPKPTARVLLGTTWAVRIAGALAVAALTWLAARALRPGSQGTALAAPSGVRNST
jgi:hypothetical protein